MFNGPLLGTSAYRPARELLLAYAHAVSIVTYHLKHLSRCQSCYISTSQILDHLHQTAVLISLPITCCHLGSLEGDVSALNLGREHARLSCSDLQGH